jgi:guanosine-3',5'-bis(diphosphate) 3'-pyrophosphohydrolase
MTLPTHVQLLRAIRYAAEKHRSQRRKGADGAPYINHPIEVSELLALVGGIGDLVVLQAAVLHDTIEDTATTPDELEAVFGAEVCGLVLEVTDDKTLPKLERKLLQIVHAPHLSVRARAIKIADKVCNVRDVTQTPPAAWSIDRRSEYLDWAERVVAGCRGVNEPLERLFDQTLSRARHILRAAGK